MFESVAAFKGFVGNDGDRFCIDARGEGEGSAGGGVAGGDGDVIACDFEGEVVESGGFEGGEGGEEEE